MGESGGGWVGVYENVATVGEETTLISIDTNQWKIMRACTIIHMRRVYSKLSSNDDAESV